MQPIGCCYWKGGDINPWILSPVGYFKTVCSLRSDWCCMTGPEEGVNGRSLQWPCGGVLGGSRSINSLIYVRGRAGAHDRWAESGSRGWAFDDALPYFQKNAGSGAGVVDGRLIQMRAVVAAIVQETVSGDTDAPTILAAEKAAEIIREDNSA